MKKFINAPAGILQTIKAGKTVRVYCQGKDVTTSIDRVTRQQSHEKDWPLYFDGKGNVHLIFNPTPEHIREMRGIKNITSNMIGMNLKETLKTAQVAESVKAPSETNTMIKQIHESVNMKPSDIILSDTKWKYLVRNILRGKSLLLTGAAGAGKTTIAFSAARALQRPEFYFSLGSTQDPRSTLVGNTHYSPESGTYFKQSLFVQAIQTPNAVIVLDEISRAHPEAFNILMPVLDPMQRYMRMDESANTETVKVADGVCFIATANEGNEYTSTRTLDRALRDRFTILEMDPLDYEGEIKLLKIKFPTAPTGYLEQVASIARDIRNEFKSPDSRLSTTISSRSTIEMVSLLVDGFNLIEAVEVALYPFFSSDGGTESERSFVKVTAEKYLGGKGAKSTLFS